MSYRNKLKLVWIIPFFAIINQLPGLAYCQESNSDPVAIVDEELLKLQKQLRSPRDTVLTFLKAMEKGDFTLAYHCLDLSAMDAGTAAAKRQTYAFKLQLALKKYLNDFDLITLSEEADEQELPYPLSSSAELEGINLVRTSKELWVLSKSSIELLDGSEFDYLLVDDTRENEAVQATLSIPLWIQQQFDESWWETTFLLKDYQWICLLLLLLAGLLIGQIAKFMLDYFTKLWFRITGTDVDDQPRLKLWTPVVSLIHIWIWYWGTQYVDLPSHVMGIILPILTFFMVLAAVWTAFRLINLLQNYLTKRAKLTASRYDDSLVPLIGSALKLVALALGIILFVDVFEKDWKALLGGFGVVGIAVAIAAKDMLGNIFGSVTVLADRPFEIGDWVVIDQNVEGIVEQVGIRSSRLRTFHDSEIIVPNSLLTTAIVDNMGRRNYRRFKTVLQVRYDTTADQLEAFCAGVRKLIAISPYSKSETSLVFVNNFGASSIDVLLYVFFECSDWTTELRERHCLIRDILKLAEKMGVGFAFPTRTIELESRGSDLPDFVLEDGKSAHEMGQYLAESIHQKKNQ